MRYGRPWQVWARRTFYVIGNTLSELRHLCRFEHRSNMIWLALKQTLLKKDWRGETSLAVTEVTEVIMIFFFFFLKIDWLIDWLLCWVFVSVLGLSLVAASGGHSSSQCTDLSPSRPLPLRSTGSRRAGSVLVAHGPSRSAACGILPDQGSNPCPLH